MKVNVNALSVAIASLCFASQSHAVYNLYTKDGLSVDLNGEIGVMAYKKESTFTALNEGGVQLSKAIELAQGTTEEQSDKRVRLGEEAGSSWIEVRGSQKMNDGWRATGTIGLGYVGRNALTTQGGAYLSTANVSIDKKNLGAVTVGRQFLHTAYVPRTGTYTPLENYGGQSIRLDYTGVPNLHTSAYYNLPSSSDVRTKNKDETKGYGASASYLYPINDKSSVRVAAGYTNSERNPINEDDSVAVGTKSSAVSLEYRYDRLLLAADYGKRKEDIKGYYVDNADIDYLGAKIGYAVTPTFNVAVGYGTKDIKRNPIAARQNIDAASLNSWVKAYGRLDYFLESVEEKRVYTQADYYLRNNLRLYGRVDNYETQTRARDENYAKLDTTEYRAGISFLF